MEQQAKINGWKLTARVIFLGPVYFFFHLFDFRRHYSFAKHIIWLIPALFLGSAYLSFSLTFNPYLIRLVYFFLLVSMFGLTFIGCWIIDSKSAPRQKKSRLQMNLSRALAWMVFLVYCSSGWRMLPGLHISGRLANKLPSIFLRIWTYFMSGCRSDLFMDLSTA